ncbi:MAG: 23S rRNA (uracil(1939)-C(5))-methyltransferase RlmD [Candidatus Scatomorpha sp.]
MKKNDIFEAVCEAYDAFGMGVLRHEGMVIFCRGILEGERALCRLIKDKKTYGYAKIEELLEKNPERREPICPVFGLCGGCDLMHMSYKEELRLKRENVKAAFLKIGGMDIEPEETVPSEIFLRYRNKVQLPLSREKNPKIGFFRKNTNEIIEFHDCLMQTELSNEIIREIKSLLEAGDASALRHIIIRHAYFENEVMLILVSEKDSDYGFLTKPLIQKFSEIKSIILNINKRKDNVILGKRERTLFGEDRIREKLCGLEFKISSKAFFQINARQCERLYKRALDSLELKKDDVLVDLYCGIGTMALIAANSVKKVYGIEIVKEAIDNAFENAAINKIENAEFFCADAAEGARIIKERGLKPTALIVDPPRKGLSPDAIDAIVKISPEKISYVSCNEATLARDVKILREKGYEIKSLAPYDMFPRTRHVECVVLMSRVEK